MKNYNCVEKKHEKEKKTKNKDGRSGETERCMYIKSHNAKAW